MKLAVEFSRQTAVIRNGDSRPGCRILSLTYTRVCSDSGERLDTVLSKFNTILLNQHTLTDIDCVNTITNYFHIWPCKLDFMVLNVNSF